MSATYSALPGNVSLASGVSIQIPTDLDADSAASFTPGYQKLADYAEAMRTRVRSGAIMSFSWVAGQGGTFAASNTIVTLAPSGGSALTTTMGSDVTATPATFKLTANVGGMYRVFLSRQLSNSTANAVTATVQKNGSTALVPTADFGPMPVSSGAASFCVAEVYLTLVATDFVQVGFYGISGQTYVVSGPFQWFGMERIA